MPSSSARTSRARWKAASASACRPSRYSARSAAPTGARAWGGRASSASSSPIHAACSPMRQEPLEPLFLGAEPHLVQPRRLGEERRAVRHVGEGGSSPQGERVLEGRHGDPGIHRGRGAGFADESVEPGGVELAGIDRSTGSRAGGRVAGPRRATAASSRRRSAGCCAPSRAVRRPRPRRSGSPPARPGSRGSSSVARTARCFGPPRAMGPSPASTSSGPRTRNCTGRR